jgi:biotin carboxylase
VLLGGAKRKGRLFIEQAHARGLRVWLADTDEHIQSAAQIVQLADRVTTLQYDNVAACVAWADEYARQESVLAVIAQTEFAVESATAMAYTLGLPGNPPQAIHTIRNKNICRHVLQENGFKQPASQLCTTLEQAYEFAQAHQPGPWIVKPPASGGSEGVSLVRDDSGWAQAMLHLGYSLPAPFLVECFQGGREFSAEGVFVAGTPQVIALTSKITTQAPHFIETGHTMPAALAPALTQRIKEMVSSALLTVGMQWGLFHAEFWLEQEEIVLGELHARSGGDNLHLMTELISGLELYGLIFDQLLGKEVDPGPWQMRGGAAIRYLTIPSGRVTAITGWEAVLADPACVLAECTLHVGDESKPITSSWNRQGFILVTGVSAQAAAHHAEQLRQLVSIQVQ